MRLNRRINRSISRSKMKWKHVVDNSSQGANFSTGINTVVIYQGIDNPATNTGTQVGTGNHIRGINLELNVANSSAVGTLQILDWYIIVDPSNTFTLADPLNAGASNIKSFIFKQGMEMLYAGTPLKKTGFIKFPKKVQKIIQGQTCYLVFRTRNNLLATDSFCWKAIFKEIKA